MSIGVDNRHGAVVPSLRGWMIIARRQATCHHDERAAAGEALIVGGGSADNGYDEYDEILDGRPGGGG